MSSVTNLTELNINYLTQDQYDTALANNEINENEIYMTPYQESIVDLIYPVGSIYMSVNNVNPSTFLEGTTWEQIQDRFLLAAGSTYTAGGTGGSATTSLAETNLPSHHHSYTAPPANTGSHTLQVSEMPAHIHAMRYTVSSGGTAGQGWNYSNTRYATSGATESGALMKASGGGGGHTHPITGSSSTTGNTGSGTAFSNMPPYLTVYMWKRTA